MFYSICTTGYSTIRLVQHAYYYVVQLNCAALFLSEICRIVLGIAFVNINLKVKYFYIFIEEDSFDKYSTYYYFSYIVPSLLISAKSKFHVRWHKSLYGCHLHVAAYQKYLVKLPLLISIRIFRINWIKLGSLRFYLSVCKLYNSWTASGP